MLWHSADVFSLALLAAIGSFLVGSFLGYIVGKAQIELPNGLACALF